MTASSAPVPELVTGDCFVSGPDQVVNASPSEGVLFCLKLVLASLQGCWLTPGDDWFAIAC